MRLSLLFPTIALLSFATVANAEVRRWFNVDGTRHIEAEYVEFTEGKVALRKADGVVLRLPLDSLSAADRAFVREQEAPRGDEAAGPMDPIKSTKKKLVGGIAIRKVLARKLKFNYREVPLAEMLGDLKERIGVEMVVDGNSLADAGVELDTPISMKSAGMDLGTALQASLNMAGVAWTIRHEVLMIVAKTEEGELFSVVYKIMQPLHSLTIATDVIRTVAVPRWLETGGKGRIQRLNGVLVISQTREVHEEIAERYSSVLQPIVLAYAGPQTAILRGLRQRTKLDLEEVELSKVLDQLTKEHKLKFDIDHVALAQNDIEMDSPVTIQVSGVMVESALGIILDSLKLVSYVEKGTIRITTRRNKVADTDLVQRTYNVTRLRPLAKTSDLEDLIENLVARDSWEDHGGKGEIGRSQIARRGIIVRQSPAVHMQINRLLSELALAL